VAPSRFRSRPSYVLAILALAGVTLVTLDDRGNGSSELRHLRSNAQSVLSSVQSGIHDGLRPVGNFLTGTVDYGSLKAENARLRDEVAAGRSAQYRAAYDQAQADQVLHFSDIPFAQQYRTVVASVIDQPSSNFDETVTIGKGTTSGIAVGQPVVTPAGLAGRVSAAGARSATVTLITDPQLVVGVGLPGGNVGSAQSLGPTGGLNVSVIATSVAAPDLKMHSVLYTSAVGQAFPQGIPVGTVSSVRRSAGETEPSITVSPLAATADMSYVTVVFWLPQ
jgi:rod shape-determining protein MreC